MTRAPSGWVSERVQITTKGGITGRSAWVHPSVRGLAVTLSTENGKHRDRWVVTHIASGRVIQSVEFFKQNKLPIDFPLATTKRLALALAKLADWSQTADWLTANASPEFTKQLGATFTRIVRPAKTTVAR